MSDEDVTMGPVTSAPEAAVVAAASKPEVTPEVPTAAAGEAASEAANDAADDAADEVNESADQGTDRSLNEPEAPPVGDDDSAADAPLRGNRLLEREGDLAADYLETLLDIADLDGDIDMDIEGERATVDIVGAGLGALVGENGGTLDALQELTRLAVQRETGVRSRLMLDVGGFRAARRTELTGVGRSAAEQVRRTGQPQSLPAMTPFERKVVHDAVAAVDGVMSESDGEEPQRFVVVRPADSA